MSVPSGSFTGFSLKKHQENRLHFYTFFFAESKLPEPALVFHLFLSATKASIRVRVFAIMEVLPFNDEKHADVTLCCCALLRLEPALAGKVGGEGGKLFGNALVKGRIEKTKTTNIRR